MTKMNEVNAVINSDKFFQVMSEVSNLHFMLELLKQSHRHGQVIDMQEELGKALQKAQGLKDLLLENHTWKAAE